MEHNHREDVEAVAEPKETLPLSAGGSGADQGQDQEPSDPTPPSAGSAGDADGGTDAPEEAAAGGDVAVDAP